MNCYKKLLILLTSAVITPRAFAQFNDSGISAGFFDASEEKTINFSNFHLPPLAVLFENAKSNPNILSLEKAQEIAEEEVKKQRYNLLSRISGHASYGYGKSDMYGQSASAYSYMLVQYSGSTQSYWNVGASASLSLEDIIDYKPAIKRKKLAVDQAQLAKDIAYEDLKRQIAGLFIKITNSLVTLKTASENAAMYQGAGALNLEDFHNGNMSIEGFAYTKSREDGAVATYQNLQTQITTDIITLEIMTRTPILTNATTEITLGSTVKKSDKQIAKENKALEKRIRKSSTEEQKKIEALEKAEAKAEKEAAKAAKRQQKYNF